MMVDHRYDIDRDLREAESMADALETYVHGDPLYGSVGGFGFFGSSMPSLTVGALLMRLRRLQALDVDNKLNPEQKNKLNAVGDKHAAVYAKNRNAYEGKLKREVASRLKAMSTFFEECYNDPRTCNRVYRPEALRRTVVQEAMMAMDEINVQLDDDTRKLVSRQDSNLRRYANQPIDFLLDLMLEPYYPEKTFWWLYQQPHTPEK
jgi:hypothetical protein